MSSVRRLPDACPDEAVVEVVDVNELFDLSERVAVVTGASSGLGERFARTLHDAGASVVLTARRSERLQQLVTELGPRATLVAGDLRQSRVRRKVIDTVARRHGRLDVLVNNAGICDDGPLEQQSLADLRAVLDLNLVATVDLCRLAAPLLLAPPAGTVINVSSIFGVVASRGPMAAYNASKGALLNLTRQLAAQWGARGVRVNALAPGFFPTELTGHLADPAQRTAIEQRTLLGRIPNIAEIEGPLLFLASDASSYVTGQSVIVDGGWTAT